MRPSEGRNEKWRILPVFATLKDEPARSVATKFLKIEFLEVTFIVNALSWRERFRYAVFLERSLELRAWNLVQSGMGRMNVILEGATATDRIHKGSLCKNGMDSITPFGRSRMTLGLHSHPGAEFRT